MGNQATVPLCEFHHRGIWTRFKTLKLAQTMLGPSLALEPKRFREVFGDDKALLEMTNRMIEQ